MHIKAEHGRDGTGVEVILPTPANPPQCIHGPALLFERFSQEKGGDSKRFYACSAYRNRKECALYVAEDKPWSKGKLKQRLEMFDSERKSKKWYVPISKRSEHVQDIRTVDKPFCKTCSSFVLPPDEPCLHSDHTIVSTSYKIVTAPTALLNCLTANQGNAQYIFSQESTKFISDLVTEGKFSHVLCVGTPRLHQTFNTQNKKLKSMLLDIDDRFLQFYPPTVFQHYNMSADHFFEPEGPIYFEKFLKKSKKVGLLLDPPFGALARVIGHSIDKLKERIHQIIPEAEIIVYWIYPYFLAKHISEVQSQLKMCHYVIEYENHPVFKKGKSTKSPVRIFTDQDLSHVKLPEEQYKDCEKCHRFVPKEVLHCGECGTCPTINKVSKHCRTCGRCVATHYTHCVMCEGCRPDPHHCKQPSHCHRCNQPGHKRRYCPLITGSEENKSAADNEVIKKITETSEKSADNKKYFTLSTDEEKKKIRSERKRKMKEMKNSKKKLKLQTDTA